MSPIRKILMRWMVWMVGGTVLFGAAAGAFVPSGPHILELMISRYGKARRLQISQKQIVYTPENQATGTELNETVRYVFPEVFRSDLRSSTGQRVHVVADQDALTAIDGKIVNQPDDGFDLYKDVLLYHSRELLDQKLNWLGVDVARTSLGRFQDQIAFVIGAQYPDESRSQLWVEKETFRPLRWLMVTKTAAGQLNVLEIQYLRWQLFSENWYPAQITFLENGLLVREIRVENVQVNAKFSSELFDLQQLRRQFQPAAIVPDPPGSKGMGEIDKTIEEFKKIYE